MVHTLETAKEIAWDDQIEFGKECLYEMHQMTRPAFHAYRTEGSDGKWPSHVPDAVKFNRALPHVKAMVSAIRRKDQVSALLSGKAALAAM